MKATELIQQLQKIVDENGDATISCWEFSDIGGWSETKPISKVKFYQDTWKGADEWVIE